MHSEPQTNSPTRKNLAVLAAFVLLCFATTAQAGPRVGHAECCGRPDVILIRGGAGYWPGVRSMANQFSCLGYAPKIIMGWQYKGVADEIARAHCHGRMTGGVILVGYSSGADYACLLAERLQRYGVRVQTMILIESTLGTTVPANVDYCVNYYASRRLDAIPIFRGIPVEAAGCQTVLYNIDVKAYPEFAELSRQPHLLICSSPALHQMAGGIVASRHPLSTFSTIATAVESVPEPPMLK